MALRRVEKWERLGIERLPRFEGAGGSGRFLHAVMRKWTCCPSFSVDLNLNFAMKTLAGSDLQLGCPFLAIFYGVVISVNLSGVALRLDAADGEHEAARGVGPVGADGQDAGDVEGADDLATGAELDLVPQIQAHQGVVHEQQALAQRHADVVGELHRRRARAAFLAVHHDEVGQDPGFQHGLGNAHEFPRMPQAELEAHRFAAGQFSQLLDELHQFDRRGERAVA